MSEARTIEEEKLPKMKVSEFLERLTKDMKEYTKGMSREEAHQLVHLYYATQEQRISNANRQRQLADEGHTNTIFEALAALGAHSEALVKSALTVYTDNNDVCKWMRSNLGVGPVISAGFFSALDITKTKTAGGFHKYCGLVEGQKRVRGKKLDFNPDMKRLAWLLGKSFVLTSKNKGSYYGVVYQERKAWETANNTNLVYADKAANELATKKITDEATLATLKSGMLTKQHIDMRSRRYAVKLFLSHLHEVMHWDRYGIAPPLPYPIAHLEHVHYLTVPNMTPPRGVKGKPTLTGEMVGEDIEGIVMPDSDIEDNDLD